MNTYEIFTTEYSKIVQAKTIYRAITEFMKICQEDKCITDIDNVIAIVEHDRGKEFLNVSGYDNNG